MSAQNPTSLTEWLAAIPIPWLFAGPNGAREWNAWGTILDGQVDLLRQAVKARMPDYAPSDGLQHLGGDRVLVQGPGESDANFRIRLRTAWDDWARAGTWLELLVQLYWGNFTPAVIVQQNGLGYSLSGPPTAGVDPTGLLTITTLPATTSPLESSINPTRVIPAGTPWFWFDSNTDLCSRFAVILPGPLPSQFMTVGTATFTASDTAVVTWNNAFVDTTYHIQVGAVTITDGSGPVVVVADGTTKTLTGVTALASGAFTGSCTLLAWQDGANPYADLHPADVARLQNLIKTWRSNALCVGVFALVGGEMWDYPFGLTWNGDSNVWDPPGSSVVQVLGSF